MRNYSRWHDCGLVFTREEKNCNSVVIWFYVINTDLRCLFCRHRFVSLALRAADHSRISRLPCGGVIVECREAVAFHDIPEQFLFRARVLDCLRDFGRAPEWRPCTRGIRGAAM